MAPCARTRRPLCCHAHHTDARVPPLPLSCVVRRYLDLSNNLLTCVPLTQTRITAIACYNGPRVTCVVSCLSSCVRACAFPLALSLVCRADNFFWTTTNSPPQRVVTPPRKEGLTPLTLPCVSQVYCTAGNAGTWSGGSQTCTTCAPGFSPART